MPFIFCFVTIPDRINHQKIDEISSLIYNDLYKLIPDMHMIQEWMVGYIYNIFNNHLLLRGCCALYLSLDHHYVCVQHMHKTVKT